MSRLDSIARRYLALGWVYLPIATIAVHLIGSAVLGVVTSGAIGLAGAPFLAIFGWFFVPIEMVAVTAQWYLYSVYRFSERAFWTLFSISVAPVPAVVAAIGPKEQNSEIQWAMGFGLGAALAGLSTLLVLRIMVKTITYNLEKDSVGKA